MNKATVVNDYDVKGFWICSAAWRRLESISHSLVIKKTRLPSRSPFPDSDGRSTALAMEGWTWKSSRATAPSETHQRLMSCSTIFRIKAAVT